MLGRTTTVIGKILSHYRVLEKLGEGGMGVVYKAQDTRLDRLVSLKFLPPESAADPQALARFEREARAASALNHPHICAVYDVGEHEGQPFMVMELVEGETLKERLARGALPIDEALEVGEHIASALEAAHARGIVHRDIKPSNVVITADGHAKVLDFGVAKLLDRQPSVPQETTAAPTALTSAGVTVGTAAYMAPEQALGEAVDARADLYSLGVVLYEMATGALPFAGATAVAVFDAILHGSPVPPSRYNAAIPAELERAIQRALARDRRARYQTAREMRADLKRIERDASARGGARRAGRTRAVRATAAVAAAAVVAVLVWRLWPEAEREQPPPPSSAQRVPVTSFLGAERDPALSPDGTRVAFVWDGDRGENRDLYVTVVGPGAPVRLTTDPAAEHGACWSPDGRYVTFFRPRADGAGAVYRIPSVGGPEQKLVDAREILGGHLDWSPDGRVLALSDQPDPSQPQAIYLVSIETGERRRLTTAPEGTIGDSTPAFSPDGRQIAFVRFETGNRASVLVVPRAGGAPRPVIPAGESVTGLDWTADGRELVLSFAEQLWRVPVSGGEPRPIPEAGTDAAEPSLSSRGSELAYVQTQRSPDIFDIYRAPGPAWTGTRPAPHRLIASTRSELSPQYSPDGAKIAFASDRSGAQEIWVCGSDGTNPVQITSFAGPPTGTPRWSPDSRQIAFDSRREGKADIYVVGVEGGIPRRLTPEPSDDVRPSWSRDGRWIYFGSDRSGAWQIWKAPAGGGAAVQVTRDGGREAFESADGKFIYYAKHFGSSGIWRVTVAGGDEQKITDDPSMAGWALLEEGICYVQPNPSGTTIQFFRFADRRVSKLASLGKVGLAFFLGASADGRWLVYAMAEQKGADIMLLQNFR